MYIQPSNRFDKNPEQFRYIQEGKIRHLKPPTKYTEFKAIGLWKKYVVLSLKKMN